MFEIQFQGRLVAVYDVDVRLSQEDASTLAAEGGGRLERACEWFGMCELARLSRC